MSQLKRTGVSIGFILLALGSFATVFAQSSYETLTLEIDLDGFITQAELTYPSEGAAFPTIILFHGSGPYDMDAIYAPMPNDTPISTNFRLIAETLPQNGIAVLRFNKRGVLAYGDYDQAQVQQAFSLDQLVADANIVVDTALALEQVSKVYLYGWSEGAWVAGNVAAQRNDIAGLILQGAPNGDLSSVIAYQHLDNALPYLADEIDADGDGALTLDEIATIPAGYPVSLMPQFYFYDFTSTPDEPVLNTFVNSDGDDRIDIEAELRPAIEMFITNYPSFIRGVEVSYKTSELIAQSGVPALVLHGALDGWVPVTAAEAIADANPEHATLIVYDDLGHALSAVESVVFDTFAVMDAQPLDDMAAWVLGN
jgi:hypothetical protein